MAERIQKRRTHTKKDAETTEVPVPDAEEIAKRKAETDALLDEIEEVLIENAVEFVEGYIQKGGQ